MSKSLSHLGGLQPNQPQVFVDDVALLGSQMAAVFDSSPPGLAAGGTHEDTAAIKANIIQESERAPETKLRHLGIWH